MRYFKVTRPFYVAVFYASSKAVVRDHLRQVNSTRWVSGARISEISKDAVKAFELEGGITMNLRPAAK